MSWTRFFNKHRPRAAAGAAGMPLQPPAHHQMACWRARLPQVHSALSPSQTTWMWINLMQGNGGNPK